VEKGTNPKIDRRGLLRVLAVGAGATAAGAASLSGVRAETPDASKRSRARYHAISPEVQTFYRVNRYPVK
jgi:hypothetical protein